jgi:hypothetical protein
MAPGPGHFTMAAIPLGKPRSWSLDDIPRLAKKRLTRAIVAVARRSGPLRSPLQTLLFSSCHFV